MVSVPTGRMVVEIDAAPEPFTVPVPREVAPEVKVTVPVTPEVSCAVTETDCP
jgi:hypothetical protein